MGMEDSFRSTLAMFVKIIKRQLNTENLQLINISYRIYFECNYAAFHAIGSYKYIDVSKTGRVSKLLYPL